VSKKVELTSAQGKELAAIVKAYGTLYYEQVRVRVIKDLPVPPPNLVLDILDPPPTLLEKVARHLWNNGDNPLSSDEADQHWDSLRHSDREEWRKDAAAILDVVATDVETLMSDPIYAAYPRTTKAIADRLRGTSAR
jgi:hypothetical protein